MMKNPFSVLERTDLGSDLNTYFNSFQSIINLAHINNAAILSEQMQLVKTFFPNSLILVIWFHLIVIKKNIELSFLRFGLSQALKFYQVTDSEQINNFFE